MVGLGGRFGAGPLCLGLGMHAWECAGGLVCMHEISGTNGTGEVIGLLASFFVRLNHVSQIESIFVSNFFIKWLKLILQTIRVASLEVCNQLSIISMGSHLLFLWSGRSLWLFNFPFNSSPSNLCNV